MRAFLGLAILLCLFLLAARWQDRWTGGLVAQHEARRAERDPEYAALYGL